MRALADRERIRRLMEALGRAARDEAMGRFALTPEKFEMWQGRLFWSEADRLVLLGLLLENVGADAAVRLGSPEIWRGRGQALGLTLGLRARVGPSGRWRAGRRPCYGWPHAFWAGSGKWRQGDSRGVILS